MKEFQPALRIFLVFTLLTGIVYPLVMTGVAQIAFRRQANGTLVESGGRVIGSELVGQAFTKPEYFHGRPSANDYDASNSGGSNYGPTSAALMKQVADRVAAVRIENGLPSDAYIPADLVTASASGLDPDISVEGALLQAPRVAKARGLPLSGVESLVRAHVEKPWLGFWGQPRVNVLLLNLSLDKAMSGKR